MAYDNAGNLMTRTVAVDEPYSMVYQYTYDEKGRQKTIEERRKRVHAFVQGNFVSAGEIKPLDMNRVIMYDPYITPLFKDVSSDDYLLELEGEIFFEGTVIYTNESSITCPVLI